MPKDFRLTIILSIFALYFVSCAEVKYGITLRDVKEEFTLFTEGSAASEIKQADDGSVSWIATAAGGGGGGACFYVKSSKEEINIVNYESIDVELDYNTVEDKWSEDAKYPSFILRILPYDSTGMFGGFEELEIAETKSNNGTLKHTFKIPEDLPERLIKSCDFDSVLGFGIKFNDYGRGNENGDQLKVVLKNVVFNTKKKAEEDEPFDDGLKKSERGTVIEINYPTRDYSVTKDASEYEKHGWVYLPAGYDEKDKDTKYPVFILLHGFGQNENTWGLSNKGRGGRIKGFMDRGMASGDVEKFILVCVTGVASKNWGPNGAGTDTAGFNAFKNELRNDLLPYLRGNFNIEDTRDGVALAGLSMGGFQTFNIGMNECLDLISNFAGFSGFLFGEAESFIKGIDSNKKYTFFKIHNLYMTCGDADGVYNTYPSIVKAFKTWERVENFKEYTYPDGTHDFPVWFNGFRDFIHMIFK